MWLRHSVAKISVDTVFSVFPCIKCNKVFFLLRRLGNKSTYFSRYDMMMSEPFKLWSYFWLWRGLSTNFLALLFLHRFKGLFHNLVTMVLRIWNIHADWTIIKSTDENRLRFSKPYKGKIGFWYSSFTKTNFQSWRNLVKTLTMNWKFTETR